jgi:hypothetical protein
MQGLSQTIQLELNLTFLVYKEDLTCGAGLAWLQLLVAMLFLEVGWKVLDV